MTEPRNDALPTLHEVLSEDLADLLADLFEVMHLPGDDPRREVWMERKRLLLARLEHDPRLAL